MTCGFRCGRAAVSATQPVAAPVTAKGFLSTADETCRTVASARIGEIAASRIPVLFKPVSPQKLREAMLASVFAARAVRQQYLLLDMMKTARSDA